MILQMPSWLELVPEPIFFAGGLVITMMAAALLALSIVWFNNSRRLVPERLRARDYLKAFGLFTAISAIIDLGTAAGLFLLSPLQRVGPGVAAIPGGIIVIVVILVAGTRRLRRVGG